jgi:hypothetical protein
LESELEDPRPDERRGSAARAGLGSAVKWWNAATVEILALVPSKITEVHQNVKFLFSRVTFFMTNNFRPNRVFT